MQTELKNLYQCVLEGELGEAKEKIQAVIATGLPASQILNEGLIAPMGEVGRLFEEGEYFVPEMLVSAKTMQSALDILKPLLVEGGVEAIGKVVLGTVKGDLHDIGKNLVGMMVEGAGFEVIDLGVDVSPSKFIEAIVAGTDIVGLSALLTTTMPAMEETIKAITEAGLRDKVKIIVGGAPVTEAYAERIGADGFAKDASQAATLAKTLIGK